jgi:hypothetical protein
MGFVSSKIKNNKTANILHFFDMLEGKQFDRGK